MRPSHLLTAALTAASLAATPIHTLVAQNQADSGAGRPGRLERSMSEPDRLMRIVMNRRARLGIKVNLQARETDSIGAYVDAVTPGGPAAKAGLRSGDLITRVDGQSVLQPPERGGSRPSSRGDGRQSLPGLRLIELAARLEANDTVALEFRRGKERKTVAVVTQNEPEMTMEGGPPSRPFAMRFFRPDAGEVGPGRAVTDRFEIHSPGDFAPGSPLGDLELTALNPQLGAYFGATDGVLVVRAPRDGGLLLQGGDVVLAVDGRKPAGPSHLLRILRSYEPGEAFKMDVLRSHRRTTLTVKVPQRP